MENDLISRQKAVRWVKTECNPYGKPTLDFESGKRVIEHLEQMPSAQPERKTGRWIEFPNHNAYKCSECGRVIETTDGKNNVCKHYPYCHCGAKMEVEHDS